MGHPLVRVADVEVGCRVPKMRVEVRAQRLLDDEQKAGEPGEGRIVEGVVKEGFAARADGRKLLEATETGGAAGREDNEGQGWARHDIAVSGLVHRLACPPSQGARTSVTTGVGFGYRIQHRGRR